MSEKGILSDLKRCTRKSEPYDSSWEREYMLLLDGDPFVVRWERCRSLRIPYVKASGKPGHFNPDFIVERTDGTKELHEVKGTHLLDSEDTQRKIKAGTEFAYARGMVFKVITKPER